MNPTTTLDWAFVRQAVRRGWALVLVAVVAAVSVTLALTLTKEEAYSSTARYVLSPRPAGSTFDVAEAISTLDSSRSRAIVATYTEILTSDAVFNEAVTRAGYNPADVSSYEVTAAIAPEANVVQFSVTGRTPEIAKDLAVAVGAVGTRAFMDLYLIYDVTVLAAPAVPDVPIDAGLPQLLTLAVGLGLMAGFGAALLYGAPHVRRRRETAARLDAYGDAPSPNVTAFPRERTARAG